MAFQHSDKCFSPLIPLTYGEQFLFGQSSSHASSTKWMPVALSTPHSSCDNKSTPRFCQIPLCKVAGFGVRCIIGLHFFPAVYYYLLQGLGKGLDLFQHCVSHLFGADNPSEGFHQEVTSEYSCYPAQCVPCGQKVKVEILEMQVVFLLMVIGSFKFLLM